MATVYKYQSDIKNLGQDKKVCMAVTLKQYFSNCGNYLSKFIYTHTQNSSHCKYTDIGFTKKRHKCRISIK
jgi:hypothetical protein